MAAAPAVSALRVDAPVASPMAEIPRLLDYLAQVPDHRRAQGRRHSLRSILALCVVAVLCGRDHLRGIFEWGRNADPAVLEALGFHGGRTPAGSTLHRVITSLQWEFLVEAVRLWAAECLVRQDPTGQAAVAIDGKTVRGSARAGASLPHCLTAFVGSVGVTLDVAAVQASGNEVQELPAMVRRAGNVLRGRVVTADALHTQETTAIAIRDVGAHYLLPVKKNRPELFQRLEAIWQTAPGASWNLDVGSTGGREHGRFEVRRLEALAVPEGRLSEWGAACSQVFRLERRTARWDRKKKGFRHSHTVVYGITSLARTEADASRLLALVRGHWLIENVSHWCRDTVFYEDARRNSGVAGVCFNVLMNTVALTLLHWITARPAKGGKRIASSRRKLQQHPEAALALVGVGT